MAKIYADRAFLEINGREVVEIESIDFTVNENLSRVETMTRNRRSAGFRKGNLALDLNITLAVDAAIAQINLGLKDPASTANVVMIMGGDRLAFNDVEQSQMSGTSSVGAATKTLALQAIDLVDENGRSRLGDFGLV